ncbi:MAG: FG-GAP-like repeat-containing protein [Bacteroidota bacterium]
MWKDLNKIQQIVLIITMFYFVKPTIGMSQGTTPHIPEKFATGTYQSLFGDQSANSIQLMKADFTTAPSVKWSIAAIYPDYWLAPTIGDVNGDGSNEVVYVNDNGDIKALNGNTGAVIWTGAVGSTGGVAPVIADINNDGQMEVIVGGTEVNCLRGSNGTLLWQYTTGPSPNNAITSPLVTDVEGDGVKEIIYRFDNDVRALNGVNGTLIWTFPMPCNFQAHCTPTAKDVDCDGIMEIFVFGNSEYAYSLKGTTGSIIWQYQAPSLPAYEPTLAVADINNDCTDEIVFVGNDSRTIVLNAITGAQIAISGWMTTGFPNSTPCLVDIDGDDDLEIIELSSNMMMGGSPTILALSNTLATIWSTPLNPGEDWPNLFATPIAGEFKSSNSGLEILFASDWNLYLLSASSGTILWSVPLRSDGFAVGDIDNDGCVEIVAGDYTFTALDNNASSGCGIITAPVPNNDFTADSLSCNCFNITSQTSACVTSWSWEFPNATPATSSLENPGQVCFNAPGNYNVTLITNPGTSCSDTITHPVTVYPCVFSVDLQASQDSICFGECTDLSAFVIPGVPPYSYTWSSGLPSSAGPHNVCPQSTTTYYVTATDSNGDIAIDSVIITVNPLPVFSINLTQVTCNSLCNGSALITPSVGTSPYTYLWNNSQTVNPLTNLCAGNYFVTVTDHNGCSSTDAIVITEPPAILVQITHTDISCHGDSTGSIQVLSSGGMGTLTYLWSYQNQTGPTLNQIPAGFYSVTVTDSIGCSQVDTVTVVQPSPINIAITSISPAICNNPNGSATVIANGGTPGYSYVWPGATGPSASGLAAGDYIVTVTDASNCQQTLQVTIPSDPGNLVLLVITEPDHCGQGIGSATAQVSNGVSPITYQWSVPGSNGQTIQNLGEGEYTVSATDVNGCSVYATFYISNIPGPDAEFTISPPSASISNPTIFFFDETSGSVTSWQWNFGDLSGSSSQQNPAYSYNQAGTYNVFLLVTDAWGCTDTVSKPVHIQDEMTFYVPNAFTPDADGLNETFGPYGTVLDPDHFEFYIFNRWGEKLFASNNFNQRWDGKYNGRLVEQGVYIWLAIVKEIDGRPQKYEGHVSVIY